MRSLMIAVIAGFIGLSGFPSVVADETPARPGPSTHTASGEATAHEGTSTATRPHEHHQEDKLGFLGLKRYDLGIYTLVVFGLLMLIVSKCAWPLIREGLEKREANIRAALMEAQKERDEAKTLLAQARKQLDEAAMQVRAMLEEARRDAEVLRAAEREAGAREAAAERERARREITAARDAALAEIYDRAVELAALLSSKTLARSITPEDHRRLLDEAVAELQRTNPTAA